MPALNPVTDSEKIAERLRTTNTVFVACLCADWCGICREYRDGFDRLADAHPNMCFVWVDGEDHADLFDELDVENFPTILIQDSDATRFFGTVLPQASIVERMLAEIATLPNAANAPLLRRALSTPQSTGIRA
ncbi:thioredoxin [Paraburkholderia sp. BL6665CI2N2]|uniref:thioredoxin family protein n=1 Tax=Paraburkholderia sp. BL6665CI2N2 TaxID=1938806 RepID=UPI001065F66B|nr:thioredoxin family protein [Paraburkholderia sp. BL6665CI2N2]TDY22054.1 thioredoxin [Paraburkholderia sp. BL6665CI2N2]